MSSDSLSDAIVIADSLGQVVGFQIQGSSGICVTIDGSCLTSCLVVLCLNPGHLSSRYKDACRQCETSIKTALFPAQAGIVFSVKTLRSYLKAVTHGRSSPGRFHCQS